ncbi:hypothetical protein JCM10207_000016 [Rhodosporidiobolus poonsookiae]
MSTLRLSVTYNGTSKAFGVNTASERDKGTWRRTCAAIDQAFDFDDDFDYLVYQTHKDKDKSFDAKVGLKNIGPSAVEVTSRWWKNRDGIIPLRLVQIDDDNKQDSKSDIDVQVGVHPTYHLLTFSKVRPPRLVDVYAAAAKLSLAAASTENGGTKQLHMLADNGAFTKLDTEDAWKKIGWTRAVKVFEEAKAKDDWAAAPFHLGPLKFNHKSRSGYSTGVLLSPPFYSPADLADELKLKLGMQESER